MLLSSFGNDPFSDACAAYGADHLLGVVLTGMGDDGLNGAIEIFQGGGRVLVKDEESSVVWGMPGAIVKAPAAHAIVPLDHMADAIMEELR